MPHSAPPDQKRGAGNRALGALAIGLLVLLGCQTTQQACEGGDGESPSCQSEEQGEWSDKAAQEATKEFEERGPMRRR